MEVKAIRNCFVDGTLRHEGERFEYSGPKNKNLEPVKAPKSAADDPKPGTSNAGNDK